MPMFDYVRAHSVEEAIGFLSDPRYVSRPLAGGTDILVQARRAPITFQRLVDVSRVPEMKVIERRGDEIYIGAAVTYTEIVESELLNAHAACLVEASRTVGGPAIANVATLGGNIANAAHCADGIPPLVCLDATAHVRGPAGARAAPVVELVAGQRQTTLQPNELITHFSFPVLPSGARSVFLKVGPRNAPTLARISVATAGALSQEGRIQFARVAPGVVFPRPRRCIEVENLLIGERPDAALCAKAGAKAAQVMIEIAGQHWSTNYDAIALRGLVARALRRTFQLEE